MEYKVVFATSPAQLTRVVNEHIGSGWRPQGGVNVIVHMAAILIIFFLPFRASYYQAMVRGD